MVEQNYFQMTNRDGLRSLSQIQFIFNVIRILILICIIINKDEFIFSGLGILTTKDNPAYKEGYDT